MSQARQVRCCSSSSHRCATGETVRGTSPVRMTVTRRRRGAGHLLVHGLDGLQGLHRHRNSTILAASSHRMMSTPLTYCRAWWSRTRAPRCRRRRPGRVPDAWAGSPAASPASEAAAASRYRMVMSLPRSGVKTTGDQKTTSSARSSSRPQGRSPLMYRCHRATTSSIDRLSSRSSCVTSWERRPYPPAHPASRRLIAVRWRSPKSSSTRTNAVGVRHAPANEAVNPTGIEQEHADEHSQAAHRHELIPVRSSRQAVRSRRSRAPTMSAIHRLPGIPLSTKSSRWLRRLTSWFSRSSSAPTNASWLGPVTGVPASTSVMSCRMSPASGSPACRPPWPARSRRPPRSRTARPGPASRPAPRRTGRRCSGEGPRALASWPTTSSALVKLIPGARNRLAVQAGSPLPPGRARSGSAASRWRRDRARRVPHTPRQCVDGRARVAHHWQSPGESASPAADFPHHQGATAVPTYQYACTNPEGKHEFEVVQSFSDAPSAECPECGAPVRKVYGSVGVVFKGSGFYRTDSRKSASASDDASSSLVQGQFVLQGQFVVVRRRSPRPPRPPRPPTSTGGGGSKAAG